MATAAVASKMLFAHKRKLHDPLAQSLLHNYAYGFLVLSLVNIPIFFLNAGVTISYNLLIGLYGLSYAAVVISYGWFYRGSILQLTRHRFLTYVFPFIFLPGFAILATISFLIAKSSLILLYTAILWGFMLPLDGFMVALFAYLFIRSWSTSTGSQRLRDLSLPAGWLLLLFVDVWLWWQAVIYSHPDLWIIQIANVKYWFIARSLAYVLILIGLLCSHRTEASPSGLE
jgi:hypothetical protein